MLIVNDVRESANFSNEKPFAVVRFRKGASGSKFAIGSLNDGAVYSLTYNLNLIYPDAVNDEGDFSAKKAFSLFKKEMQIGAEEPANGYDVEISEISDFYAVKIVATKRIMRVIRPACYGGKDDAIRIAKASLSRQIREKVFVPLTQEEFEELQENE